MRVGQRRTNRSSELLLVCGFAVSSAWRTARRRRSLPRRNSSSVRPRMVVSAWRRVSTWSRKSARLVGYVSRTCSRACWWNPAAANVLHVAEGSGERTGSRADVHESHSRRRAQVTSYRLATLREPIARDLADRLVRRSGRLVITNPGQFTPPCWYPTRCLRRTLRAL